MEDAASIPSDSSEPASFARTLRVFRSRNFAILWVGNLLSNTGSWMQQVAEPWLVLRLSGSPTLLGLDSFAIDAPVWFFILLGGLLADRRDRRRVALFFQTLQLACPSILIALLLTGHIKVWHIIVLSFVVGLTDALSMPSIAALIPSSVPKSIVADAVAVNSAQFNASRVLGPFVAGIVLSAIGVTACFALNAASYVPFLVAIFFVRLPKPTPSSDPASDGTILEAFRTIVRVPTLRRALLKVLISSLFCAPLVTFTPVIVRDVFHLGSSAFGAALSMFGIGGLIGAATVLPIHDDAKRQVFASVAALILATMTVGIGVDHSYPLLLVLLLFAGAAMVASNTAANSILQGSIDGHLRGRVASIYTLALRGGAPLGNLATGVVVSHWGTHPALLINGSLAFLSHAFLIRVIRRRRLANA
jgi:MFS family permease